MNKQNTELEMTSVFDALPSRDCKCLVQLNDDSYRLCSYLFDGKTTDDPYSERDGMLGHFYIKHDYQGVDYIPLYDVKAWCELLCWGIDLAKV